MSTVLKRQWFKDSGIDKTELKGSKYQYLDKRDDELKNSLDEDEGKIEDIRYISSPFVSLLFLPQNVSNRLSDLAKETMSLNYLVCIPKICYSKSANFALEFPGRRNSKTQKKSIPAA